VHRKTAVGFAFLLVLATVAAYLPAFRAGFIWDDDSYVTQNETLRSLDGLRHIWLEPGAVPQYYPLVHTAFWAEYHLWGLNPAGFHVVNVLLHAANALLVWRVLRRLELRWAWLVAAVFALHPVHVESVAWVTERKNVLSALFYLLSLLAYLRCCPPIGPARASGRARRLWYVLALLAFLAALLSKTVACSLPAAILLLTWWKRGRLTWPDVRPLVPFFALGLALSVVTVRMESHMVQETGAEWNFSLLDRILIAGRAPWFYAAKLLVPTSLTFIYPKWALDPHAWWQYLYPLATATLILGLWLMRRRIGRGPLVAVLFFGGTLLPAIGLIDLYPMRYSFVADHFQYLASLGLIVLVVSGVATLLQHAYTKRVKAAPLLGVAVLAILGTNTWRQTLIYRDLETLWLDVLSKNPTAFIALNNLGIYLDHQGRTAEAIPYFERGLTVRPNDGEILNNLANAYGKTRRFEDALRIYAALLERQPDSAITHYNAGITYAQMGRFDEARRHVARAVQLAPDVEPFRAALARLHAIPPRSQPASPPG
jgi:tetratricopeptide (TPR) repeat protein